jgi:hypothetical protein
LFVLVDLYQDILGSAFRHPTDPQRHGTGSLEHSQGCVCRDEPWYSVA